MKSKDPAFHWRDNRIAVQDGDTTGTLDLSATAQKVQWESQEEKKSCFIIISGMDIGYTIPLEQPSIVLGRSDKCDIVLQDDGISRYHAEVIVNPETGQGVVKDLNSTNGTFLNGRNITQTKLQHGDKILLGRRTILKYVLQDTFELNYHEQIYDSCTRDPLTGVYNRKYMHERLQESISYTRRHHIPFTFMLFDLDHFKSINDIYGHRTGDQVLMAITLAVSNMVRSEDVFARYGGEEFAILAQGTDFQGGQVFGERVRKLIATEIIPTADDPKKTLSVTASVGVATIAPGVICTSSKLISSADENLYIAKGKGRNRVVATHIQ